MDLYDLFDFEEKLNSGDEEQNFGCWFDMFMEHKAPDIDEKTNDILPNSSHHTSPSTEDLELNNSALIDSSSVDAINPSDDICLDGTLIWNDNLNVNIDHGSDPDRTAWSHQSEANEELKTNCHVSGQSSDDRGDYHYGLIFCDNNSPSDDFSKNYVEPSRTGDVPSAGGRLVVRSGRKRRLFNPYGSFENNPKRVSNVSLLSRQTDELLILPNGEVYKRVNIPVANSEPGIGANLISKSMLRDFHHHHLPDSPSGSSDSGLSVGRHSPEIGHDGALVYPTHPAYTLSQVLLADPPIRKGVLILTDEEKNCLTSHGHPIPEFLPLNEEQEKYLKKIRRKIKNKVAAQESRRRRKEYTDMLESKMKKYQDEKKDLLEKLKNLENYNRNLVKQIKTLGERVRLTQPTKGGACFMVLVLFFALFMGSWDIKSWNIGYGNVLSHSNESNFLVNSILGPNLPKLERMLDDKKQKVLSHGPNIEHPLVENYFDVKTTSDVTEVDQTDNAGKDPFMSNIADFVFLGNCSTLPTFFYSICPRQSDDCESATYVNLESIP